jgi:hypothetical protein
LPEVRHLARPRDYGVVEALVIRSRLFVGFRDDALTWRKLDLKGAIDICRPSESTTKLLRIMIVPNEVITLQQTTNVWTTYSWITEERPQARTVNLLNTCTADAIDLCRRRRQSVSDQLHV